MSWSDPCSKCGEHRADCECGRKTIETWQVSLELRYEERFTIEWDNIRHTKEVLQQLWVSSQGKKEWRDIPTVKEKTIK